MFGGRRPAVRVIVTEKVLTKKTGHALLEGNPASVSGESMQRELCDAGYIDVTVGGSGQALDGRRTERFFTQTQRIALGVRDAGCLLCRRDHLRLHNDGWRILHDNGRYRLRLPPSVDPERKLLPCPARTH
ncbi:hypothetical protein EDD25_0241 [Cryobacterium psychrophilum]|nr:hypothetical protein EDD25_0241 [Cryobacterium psychrophilum]